mgnify:FL=1
MQSVIGGVIGGVIGSFLNDGGLPLSSDSPPRSARSLVDDAELFGRSLGRGMLSIGRKLVLGDRPDSIGLDGSLANLNHDRAGRSCTSAAAAASAAALTEVMNGPRTESFMSSYVILAAASSSDGFGAVLVTDIDRRRSRICAGRLTSRGAHGRM